MADIIQLLPDTVANQIAAGEVIQRPSSVVKELVENAVDAGANLVQVIIEEAGKTLIQVIDDGCGMSVTDARLAFERHATSKIRKADDLFALRTMGFRGEALPSIAAVAQVELRTRAEGDELGTCLHIEGGKVKSVGTVSAPRGANFAVRNLFFNIPARRKFLKSNLTEMANILSEFERLALAHPQVAFRLHRDGTLLYDLPAGPFRQRVTGLFGHRMDKQLVRVEVETDLTSISGFVGVPTSARRKRAQQFFFVNNRYMRHPYFARAVQTAYERLVPEGEQVPFFLRFEIEPAQIDVNIHPTKTEIKFQDEQTIWQILLAAVREALGKFGGVPTIDFDTANMPEIPLFIPSPSPSHREGNASGSSASFSSGKPTARAEYADAAFPPFIETDPNYSPFGQENLDETEDSPSSVTQDEAAPESLLPPGDKQLVGSATFSETLSGSPDYLQYHGRFIVCAVHSGLMLIDQHRAHMRVLFDRYLRSLDEQGTASQGLLFPQPLVLSPAEDAELAALLPKLSSLGFELRKEDGGDTYNIYGVPAGTEGIDPENLLRGILDEARSGNEQAADAINHRLALALARRAALPVGQELSSDEMSALCAQLFAGTSPNYAPDGTPILVVLEDTRIARFFD